MSRKRLINLAAVAIVVVGAYLLKAAGIDINNLGNNNQNNNQGAKVSSSSKANFDHYVMALSWSPTFCDSNKSGNQEQCAPERDYAFVVHGLWPQYDRGGWPADCAGKNAPRVPDNVIDSVRDIMPSKRLIIHEWKKHGTCSGKDPAGYYADTRNAYDNIKIPSAYTELAKPLKVTGAKVRQAFLKSNPGLTDDAIELTCDNRLREVRICMDKSLEFRSCAKPRKKCKSKEMLMLPSR